MILKTIKEYLAVLSIKPNSSGPITPTNNTTTESQDAIDVRKRLDKSFEQQAEQLQSRALKPHDKDCPDMLACVKTVCWQWEPDKIIKDIGRLDKDEKVL